MKTVAIIILAFFGSLTVLAQSRGAVGNKSFDRGRMAMTDSTVLDVRQVVLLKDSVEYYARGSFNRHAMSLSEVTLIEEYKGDHGTAGMWIGSLLGGGIGVAVALGTKDTKTTGMFQETTIQTWPIYVFTLAGGLIGYAIGSSAESWETVYKPSKLALFRQIDLQFGGNKQGLGVTCTLTL